MHKWFKPQQGDAPSADIGTPTAPRILWALPLIAVPAVPGLVWMIAVRPMAARIPMASRMALAVAIVELLVLAVLSRGFRHRIRWSASVTAAVTLMLFMWPQLTLLGRDLADALPFGFPSDPIPVLIAGTLIWLSIRIGHATSYAVTMTLGTWAAVIMLIATIAPYVETTPAAARAETAPANAPDVVLIVLDGYGRTDSWQEILGFDNTAFEKDLQELGFTVASKARSNYGITFASLSAMYDLDYLFELGPITDSDYEAMRKALSGNGAMMEQFRSAGYEIAYVENAWEGSNCGRGVDHCFRNGLGKLAIWNLGDISIFAPLVRATQMHPFNTVSAHQLESLAEYVDTNRTLGIPRLMVAHFILPHPPFHLDSECNRINSPTRAGFRAATTEDISSRMTLMGEQTLCTNSMVLAELSEILASREDTLIMITGDHGSESTLLENVEGDAWDDDAVLSERMAILSAYRVPGCESRLYPTMSPVNGTRTLTSCALGVDLPRIEDRTLWTPGIRLDVTDIGGRIDP